MVNATGRIFLEDLNVTTRCLSEYIRGNRYLPYFSSEKENAPHFYSCFSLNDQIFSIKVKRLYIKSGQSFYLMSDLLLYVSQ